MATTEKTPIYVDSQLLQAVQAIAANTGVHETEIVEDALRQYVHSAEHERSRQVLHDLLGTLGQQPAISDEEALDLSYSELHTVRRERR